VATAIDLEQYWSANLGSTVNALSCSAERLSVALDNATGLLYFFNGTRISSINATASIVSTSYCCGRFIFLASDGSVYVTNIDGKIISNFTVPIKYANYVEGIPEGMLFCSYGCALYDIHGKKIWEVPNKDMTGVPSYGDGYIYVPVIMKRELVIINALTGKVVRNITFPSFVYSTDVCGESLAVGTAKEVYLFSIKENATDPEYLWDVGSAFIVGSINFSPKCKYIAISDVAKRVVKIYDSDGNLLYSRYFDSEVSAVAWGWDWQPLLFVGLNNGELYSFYVTPG
jgi:WD40 repeat protein